MTLPLLQIAVRALMETLGSAEIQGNGDLPEREFQAILADDMARVWKLLEPDSAPAPMTREDWDAHEADFANKERRTA
jgi:hypothetical protein